MKRKMKKKNFFFKKKKGFFSRKWKSGKVNIAALNK